MIFKLWGLVQEQARPKFLALLFMVSLGGFVELLGISATAEMMGLVASKGETFSNGPLSHLMRQTEVDDSTQRLTMGLFLTVLVLGGVHAYSVAKTYLRSQFVWIQDKEISTRLFSACLHRPYPWFLQRNSGELQRLLSSGHITQGLLNSLISAVGHLAIASTLTLALFVIDPRVAIVGLLVVCSAYGAVRIFTHKIVGEKGANAHRFDTARRVITQEALTSIRFVKTTAREPFFVKQFEKYSEGASKGMVFHGIYVDTVRAFLEWVTYAGILSLSVYLVSGSESFDTLLPKLTIYTMAGYRIVPAIHELFGLWSRLRFDSHYIEQVEELLYTPQESQDQREKLVGLDESPTLLSLRKVSFQYQGAERESVKELDLEVNRGQWIGVVGTTGAGKTTLLDLISGLIPSLGGEILVGGTELTSRVVKDWQAHIAVVPQEVILLDDTLSRNVAFGVEAESIDHELIREVCEMAGLSQFLQGLPEGLETRLGERGTRLSGGERQRVGLARALYRKPSLLLLDEATSALDQETERKIIHTLKSLVSECTMVTVAHRLSSVKPCHQIIVMENGEIVERGTFEELLQRSPSFQRLALHSIAT